LTDTAHSRASPLPHWFLIDLKICGQPKADDRVYFIDAQLGEAEKDGKVVTPMHLDAE
jgi:hypothetical protein